MNIFVLDRDPRVAAEYHSDKHVVKMPTETAQMVSFVYHDPSLWQGEIPDFVMAFSKSHYNHPCSVWMRESLSNFTFSCRLGLELYHEYQHRYNRPDRHGRARRIFEFALANPPGIEERGLTDFATAMDERYLRGDAVESYRNYYRMAKSHIHSWRNRTKPSWI